MAIQNRQLTGNNLCDIPCTDKEKIIHPETCTEAVLMECENQDNFSLKDWILGDLDGTPTFHTSLKEWLLNYYNGNIVFDLPTASSNTLGGVKIGSGINIYNGIISVDLPVATTSAQGIVQIGDNLNVNNGTISVPIANHIYPVTERQNPYAPGVVAINNVIKELDLNDNNSQRIEGVEYHTLGSTSATNSEVYAIPIDIVVTPSDDPNVDDYRIFAPIPIDLFEYENIRNTPTILQSDWTQTDSTKKDYIKHKPDLATVAITGNYQDLNNLPIREKFEKFYSVGMSDFEVDAVIDTLCTKVNNDSVASLGFTSEINIDIIRNDNTSMDIDDYIHKIKELIDALCDVVKANLSDKQQITRTALNISFNIETYGGSILRIDPVFDYLGKNAVNTICCYAVQGDNISHSPNDSTIHLEIPSGNKCTLTLDFRITKATLNVNETSRLYTTIWKYKTEELKDFNTNLD